MQNKLYERLVARIQINTEGCWIWQGATSSAGYGVISVGNKDINVHRAIMLAVGEELIPGQVVDHQCHNRAVAAGTCRGGPACPHRLCINPEHLKQVTHGENNAAAIAPDCKNGHPRVGEDAYWNGRQFVCRVCQREWQRQYRIRRQMAA